MLSESRWSILVEQFKLVFFQVYSMKSSSALEVLFQSGIISLKTCFCYSKNNINNKNSPCPVCNEEIGKLGKSLPSSHHPVSALICRISGTIMDHLNPPMSLPNGQIYSEKVI